MGVARDFGPWGLNAREFRRAGLNPRWWLARRVNQSATDGMGGVVIFRVKRRGPLPAGRPPPFRGAARTPSLPRTPSLRRRGPPPSVGADPLSLCRGPLPTILPSVGADAPLIPLPRPPPHHSVSAARTFSLPRTLSLYCRGPLPTIPSSVGAALPRTPSLWRRGPPLAIAADPLSPPFSLGGGGMMACEI
ncbi:hypothetical protein niasHT_006174 [Heterodera trifolii]|uniref:Uncharacterized protein n=1 Tax=Heterodera trifolii TaxID=157864 RepID=A0ABD2M2C3_9BILA